MNKIVLIAVAITFLVSCSHDKEADFRKRYLTANHYMNNGQYDSCINVSKKLDSDFPNRAEAQLSLGMCELARDSYDSNGNIINAKKANEGLAHLAKAAALEPTTSRYSLVYAGILAETGQCDKATPIFDKRYEDLKREALASAKIVYVRYAQCLVEEGSMSDALSVLSDLEQSGPVNAEVLKKAAALREEIIARMGEKKKLSTIK